MFNLADGVETVAIRWNQIEWPKVSAVFGCYGGIG